MAVHEIRITPHAALRYAARVLGLDPTLVGDKPSKLERCVRGAGRLLEKAERRIPLTEDARDGVYVCRTRAAVVRGGALRTVLVSRTPRGFSESALARIAANARRAQEEEDDDDR